MSTIKANTLLHSDGSTTTQPSIPALDTRMAKAWARFNGTGTVAFIGNYNCSSITDIGTGNYTVNFTSAISGNSSCAYGGDTYNCVASVNGGGTGVSVQTLNASAGNVDNANVCINIFGT